MCIFLDILLTKKILMHNKDIKKKLAIKKFFCLFTIKVNFSHG